MCGLIVLFKYSITSALNYNFTTEPTHGSNEWMEEKDANVSDTKEKKRNTNPFKYNKRDTGLKGGTILISQSKLLIPLSLKFVFDEPYFTMGYADLKLTATNLTYTYNEAYTGYQVGK